MRTVTGGELSVTGETVSLIGRFAASSPVPPVPIRDGGLEWRKWPAAKSAPKGITP